MVAFDENLLLYAGAALHQLADELHERRAENLLKIKIKPIEKKENRVLLVADTRHCATAPAASLSNHRPVARLRVSRHWEVQLGKEREEHLRFVSFCIFLSRIFINLNAPN